MAHLPITDTLEAKLQRVAAKYGLSLTRFLEKVADDYGATASRPVEAAPVEQPVNGQAAYELAEAIIEREQAAYEEQHPELYKQYAGEYLAMHNGVVVDHDLDRVALKKRIRARYGKQTILVTPVLPEPRQIIMVRSPKLEINYGKSLAIEKSANEQTISG